MTQQDNEGGSRREAHEVEQGATDGLVPGSILTDGRGAALEQRQHGSEAPLS